MRSKLIAFMAAVLFTVCVSTAANGHSWYDNECCHDRDCAEVVSMRQLPNNGVEVTTKLGTGVMIETTKMKKSLDEKDHACIIYGKIICFYGATRF